MRDRTVMGVFDRPVDAEKARDELLEAGIARHRIVISRAAEVRPEEDSEKACLVAVVVRSPVDRRHIAELMLRHGARETN